MLSGVHVLLTYTCTFECDHCFLFCGPWTRGTFTLAQIRELLDQVQKIESVDHVFFEGGEPLLNYALLLEAIREARERGLEVGLVTNAYPSNSALDAELWIEPLVAAGLNFLSISDDSFHYPDRENSPARITLDVAAGLSIYVDSIAVSNPGAAAGTKGESGRGGPTEGSRAMFRGRAADKLTSGLERKDWQELDKCPYEDLVSPSRVHVDAFGHVHICQGLLMGNIWETPLPRLVEQYDSNSHPICSALNEGGPALLARRLKIRPEPGYADECHFCFLLRRLLLDRYPGYLGPRQVYGPGY